MFHIHVLVLMYYIFICVQLEVLSLKVNCVVIFVVLLNVHLLYQSNDVIRDTCNYTSDHFMY